MAVSLMSHHYHFTIFVKHHAVKSRVIKIAFTIYCETVPKHVPPHDDGGIYSKEPSPNLHPPNVRGAYVYSFYCGMISRDRILRTYFDDHQMNSKYERLW